MATVSEQRVTELAKLMYWKAFEFAEHPANGVLEIADLIEQALLAERRLAMEEAAKIADQWANSSSCEAHEYDPCCHVRTGAGIAAKLRAAAEKEVGTK